MRRIGPRATKGTQKTRKNLNIEMVKKHWDKLYQIAARLAEIKGVKHCTLLDTILYLIETSPLGESDGRKPAAKSRAA